MKSCKTDTCKSGDYCIFPFLVWYASITYTAHCVTQCSGKLSCNAMNDIYRLTRLSILKYIHVNCNELLVHYSPLVL